MLVTIRDYKTTELVASFELVKNTRNKFTINKSPKSLTFKFMLTPILKSINSGEPEGVCRDDIEAPIYATWTTK
jgi:hypothetical protein